MYNYDYNFNEFGKFFVKLKMLNAKIDDGDKGLVLCEFFAKLIT